MRARAPTLRAESSRTEFVWGALSILVAVAVLVLTGLHVDGNYASAAEAAAFRIINGFPSLIYWPAWVVMQLGNLIAVPAVAVVALLFRRYRLAIAALIVGIGKWYSSRLLKDVFLRERPASVLSDVVLRDAPAAGQAFVSGHAVIAVGLAVVVNPYVGRKWRIVVWALALLVCVARVFVGAHLPLDVVGGAAAGWAIGTVANMVTGLFMRKA
jgi:membrane-associated phospholipid phosphatase